MIDPKQSIAILVASLSAIGVLSGVGTYTKIQRNREAAKVEISDTLKSIEDFYSRAMSQCEEAEALLSQVKALYDDYLSEIRCMQVRLAEANRRRQELIKERRAMDSQLAVLIVSIHESYAQAELRLRETEGVLLRSKDLTDSDREEYQRQLLQHQEALNALLGKVKRVEDLRQKNSALLDEMSMSASRFLRAIRQAEEAKAETNRLRDKTESRQRQVEQSKETIDRMLMDVRQSLENIGEG